MVNFPISMVIFHSYVELSEGTANIDYGWMLVDTAEKSLSKGWLRPQIFC